MIGLPLAFNKEANGDVAVLKKDSSTQVRPKGNFLNDGGKKVPG